MGFTSYTFIFIFMPVSIIAYLIGMRFNNKKISNIILIITNLLFYSWTGLDSLLFFILVTIIVYLGGCYIYYNINNKKKQMANKCLVLLCILFVIYFFALRYYERIIEGFGYIQSDNNKVIALVGVSYLIFEIISYLTDIYCNNAKPGSYLNLVIFLSLFTKMLSGPIVLWRDFQSQTLKLNKVSMKNISNGIDRIAVGFAKKAILADSFGYHISIIENEMVYGEVDALTVWLKSILFFFQIYYDFSGYSDIAIGLSKIFGFSFKDNFNFPYISKSVSEFWRRWHISLGTWFREYVYIPLGGNRKGNVYVNLFIVFFLTGIWHGANLNFLLWGIINGIAVMIERVIREKKWYLGIPDIIKWMCTVTFVFFCWIIFDANTITEAFNTIKLMFSTSQRNISFTYNYYFTTKIILLLIIAVIGSIACLIPKNILDNKRWNNKWFLGLRKVGSILLFVISILFVVNLSYSPFIYFKF